MLSSTRYRNSKLINKTNILFVLSPPLFKKNIFPFSLFSTVSSYQLAFFFPSSLVLFPFHLWVMMVVDCGSWMRFGLILVDFMGFGFEISSGLSFDSLISVRESWWWLDCGSFFPYFFFFFFTLMPWFVVVASESTVEVAVAVVLCCDGLAFVLDVYHYFNELFILF